MNVRSTLESEINQAETQEGPFALETWRYEKSL
jgi:hypothetical protein